MKIIALIILTLNVFAQSNNFNKQQTQVKEVITTINDVRKHPENHRKMYRTFYIEDYMVGKNQLKYDKNLSKECYEYAKYMATTGDFRHSRCNNYSESISFGGHYITEVLEFLNETNAPKGVDGHRKHMLGSPPFHNDKYVGVGFYCYNRRLYTVIRTK